MINATGDVIVAGTISPGNSPGRVTINCNLIALPGSLLILDILDSAGDFSFDQLRIGNDSTFSLNDLHVVFNFLGDTDPNAFAATGGFDMDNFIQSLNQQTGEVTGLSSVFAPGQTWNDVLGDHITAVSDFDVSNVQIGGGRDRDYRDRCPGAFDLGDAPTGADRHRQHGAAARALARSLSDRCSRAGGSTR